jgi:riboflavin kinase/FMN adenylyltransferase
MTGRAVFLSVDDAPDHLSAPKDGPCVLVVGNFDGVHLGHQAVLREAVAEGERLGLPARVLTFEPHPAAVVGSGAPPVLTTLERRVELMEDLGVARVYVRRFDAAFAAWSPERFARELVAATLGARLVVVGQNFRFGARRAGDLALLRQLGAELGFQARVHTIAADVHGPFSSTRIREAIATSDLDEVYRVLGRPHALSGPVVHGDELGRTLGFPTANLEPVAEMLPRDGIYAVRVEVRRPGPGDVGFERLGGGATSIGVRPTVGGTQRTVETYVLGFQGDLYGAELRVELVAHLREERRFDSLAELKLQIARDVDETKAILGSSGEGPRNPQDT